MRACLLGAVFTLAMLPLAGCTMFPDKQPATLQMTTSAEQVNRIFFENVSAGKWESLTALMATNVAWSTPGQTLRDRAAIVAYLQAWKASAAQVSAAELQSNGDSLTELFTLQWNANGATQTRRMTAVWQHVPGKKANTPYLLTVMAEQPSRP